MTSLTANAFMYVNAVVEIYKTGQVVHSGPFERMIFTKARPYRFEGWAIRPNLLVAVHAHFCGRYSGKGAALDADMTVTAVDAEAGYMVLMAEWYRLLSYHILVADVRGRDQVGPCPDRNNQNKQPAKYG